MSKNNGEILEMENPVRTNLNTGETKTTEQILENNKDLVINHLNNQVSLYSSDKDVVKKAVNENRAIEAMIENVLKSGTHYGFIPGTPKKTLLQPGADILARTYGIEIRYELVDKEIDLQNDLIDYTYKAIAYFQDKQVGEADASANSYEQKFRGHY